MASSPRQDSLAKGPEPENQDDLAPWLRLTLAPGLGPRTQQTLLGVFGLPDQIFAAGRLAVSQHISPRLADSLFDHAWEAAWQATQAWLAAHPQRHLVTLADPAYPRALLDTPDPPTLLYALGDLSLLNRPSVAIVGSRNATPQGLRDAEAFAASLSAAGYGIVSGLALGIDAAAHRGGLSGPGGTIAVIGTGIDRIYPAANRELAHAIARSGCIISEFALGMPAAAHHFPKRNRLIAGLAQGCLVVEAALASGSLITARLATDLGREVFAIPGSIHSPMSKGCHQLIRQGAKLVETAQDILEELPKHQRPGGDTPDKAATDVSPEPIAADSPCPEDADTGKVLAALGHESSPVDTLCARSGLTPDRVLAILVTLELEGRAASLPGGRFQRLHPSPSS